MKQNTYETGKKYRPGSKFAAAFYMDGSFKITRKEWNVFTKDWEYDLHWTDIHGTPSGTHMSARDLAWWQSRK